MAIYAYFDESGKHKQDPVVSLGCVVAKPDQMGQFDSEWRYCLKEVGLESLHMNEALNLAMPLSAKHEAREMNERIVALLPFIDCLKKRTELAVGVAADCTAFKSMSSDALEQLTQNPHYAAFARAVMNILKEFSEGEKISVICDDEEHATPRIYRLYRKLKGTYPTANKRLASLCMADDEVFSGLQAADMVRGYFA